MIQTLISEALSSDKTLDEIKDLLCLKICNLDTHTSVSHVMEIQQKDIILSSSQHENVEKKLEEWRKVMEERFKIQ